MCAFHIFIYATVLKHITSKDVPVIKHHDMKTYYSLT